MFCVVILKEDEVLKCIPTSWVRKYKTYKNNKHKELRVFISNDLTAMGTIFDPCNDSNYLAYIKRIDICNISHINILFK